LAGSGKGLGRSNGVFGSWNFGHVVVFRKDETEENEGKGYSSQCRVYFHAI